MDGCLPPVSRNPYQVANVATGAAARGIRQVRAIAEGDETDGDAGDDPPRPTPISDLLRSEYVAIAQDRLRGTARASRVLRTIVGDGLPSIEQGYDERTATTNGFEPVLSGVNAAGQACWPLSHVHHR